jgi:hypothetical protein
MILCLHLHGPHLLHVLGDHLVLLLLLLGH